MQRPQFFPRPMRLAMALGTATLLAGGGAQGVTALTTTRVAAGFARPVFVTSPPGDTLRLFVVEQRGSDGRGRIKIVENGLVLPAPFLTTDVLSTGSEQGLLGLAFAPDYAQSRRFYIHYTDAGGTTRLVRYQASGADPDLADAGTAELIYSVAQPYTNHNGGWIAFGPDGYLYMALGDGGSGGDPGDRAQDIEVPLGKILRFDVSDPDTVAVAAPGNPFAGPTPGLDEIWSFGLRNPWRCSIDRETGDLIIADVGQTAWEEIDFAPASAGRGPGWNYGWRCYEGNVAYAASATTPCGSCTAPECSLVFPAHVFGHTLGRCSVTGGYVYRGCQIPDLQGTYFFADYCGGQIYSGRFAAGTLTQLADRTAELDPPGSLAIATISSFGEDANGELYICDLAGGEVFKIVPRDPVAEADMPVLRVATAGGDTLGMTTPGNPLGPGIVPFADAGSRIRGVGFLRHATVRRCPDRNGDCLTTHVRLGAFDVDITGCVDADSATLTRTFVFRNGGPAPQPLVFVDVVAPYLNGDADRAYAGAAPAPGTSASLVLFDATNPDLYVSQRGYANGAAFSMDVDSALALAARVESDQPLTNRAAAGPGHCALALGFDFGTLAAGAAESLVVVTRLETSLPVGVEPALAATPAARLRAMSAMPFRDRLRLAVDLPAPAPLHLAVYDVRGHRVRTVFEGSMSPGTHTMWWDGRDGEGREAGPGVYFLRLRSGSREHALRVVRLR